MSHKTFLTATAGCRGLFQDCGLCPDPAHHLKQLVLEYNMMGAVLKHASLPTAGSCRTCQALGLPVVAPHGYHSEVPQNHAQLAQVPQREAAQAPNSSDMHGQPADTADWDVLSSSAQSDGREADGLFATAH